MKKYYFIFAVFILNVALAQNPFHFASKQSHNLHIIEHGPAAYAARVEMIRSTQELLQIEAFEYAMDSSGVSLLREMIERVRQADQSRSTRPRFEILIDRSLVMADELLNPMAKWQIFKFKNEIELLKAYNIEVKVYDNGSHNRNRDHRKLWIKDPYSSKPEVLLGGRNISTSYFDSHNEYNFLDRDVLINPSKSGSSSFLQLMAQSFNLFFHSTEAKGFRNQSIFQSKKHLGLDPITYEHLLKSDYRRAIKRLLNNQIFEEHSKRLLYIGTIQSKYSRSAVACSDLEFISDGPESLTPGKRFVRDYILNFMWNSQKNLLIESPYINNFQGLEATLNALAHRRIYPHLLTNSMRATEFPEMFITYETAMAKYGSQVHFSLYTGSFPQEMNPLFNSELRLKNPDIQRAYQESHYLPITNAQTLWGIHGKSVVRDNKDAMIGSFNFDHQAADYNAELMLVCHNNVELASLLTSYIQAHMGKNSIDLIHGHHPDVQSGHFWGTTTEQRARYQKGVTFLPLIRAFE